MAKASSQWRNRIVGYGAESPDQLLGNPKNMRIHPKRQQDALAGSLDEVGVVQGVIINKRTSEEWPACEPAARTQERIRDKYQLRAVAGHVRGGETVRDTGAMRHGHDMVWQAEWNQKSCRGGDIAIRNRQDRIGTDGRRHPAVVQ